MKKATIRMVMSDGCDRCKIVERRILDAARKVGVHVDLRKIDCRTPEAVGLGIDHGLDDVPSFVVGDKGFSGDDFHDAELEAAISHAGK